MTLRDLIEGCAFRFKSTHLTFSWQQPRELARPDCCVFEQFKNAVDGLAQTAMHSCTRRIALPGASLLVGVRASASHR